MASFRIVRTLVASFIPRTNGARSLCQSPRRRPSLFLDVLEDRLGELVVVFRRVVGKCGYLRLVTFLTPARKTTILWICIGGAITVVTASASIAFWPAVPPPPTQTERLGAAVLLLRWPAAIVAAMVMSLFRIFDRESALDPVTGDASRRHRVGQRALTNTLEQLAIFVPGFLGFAMLAHDAASYRFVGMAVALFSIGRILFWGGYHVSANARGLGFNLSFVTSIATLVATFYLAARGG